MQTLRAIMLLCVGFCATPLAAVPLWSVESASGTSTVLLLGSVHLLRAEDQPLPGIMRQAYQRADRVVLELDPEELTPAASTAALERVGVMSPGGSVLETLSPEEWRHAERLAREADVDLGAVAMLEPWFAAIALHTGALAMAGYEPALGVDRQVADWAEKDRKPVTGLETVDEQLVLFKHLDAPTQRQVFFKALEELPAMRSETAELVARWREGDIDALAQRLEEDFEGLAELRDRIVLDRNRAWLPAIESLLRIPGTSLVVVGALHLVGPHGVPALLAERLPEAQISIISKSSLPAPQSGQRQLNGTSSHLVPGGIPPSASPSASSYTYPQMTHIQAFIDDPPRR
jgi:uncharacterized protein